MMAKNIRLWKTEQKWHTKDGTAPMYSFENLLRTWLGRIIPDMILEWGPGYSTEVMIQECPDADIYSVENDLNYFIEAGRNFGRFPRVRLIHASTQEHYVNPPILRDMTFNLIFVDGRHRAECLKSCLYKLKENGVVLLHDSDRQDYAEALKLFEALDYRDGTVALKPC
jgi:predicted O-methyltransferase YrrM